MRQVAILFAVIIASAATPLSGSARASSMSLPKPPVELTLTTPDTIIHAGTPCTLGLRVVVYDSVQHRSDHHDLVYYSLGRGMSWVAGEKWIPVRLQKGHDQTHKLIVAALWEGPYTVQACVRTDGVEVPDDSLKTKVVYSTKACVSKTLKVAPVQRRPDINLNSPTVELRSAEDLGITTGPPSGTVQVDSTASPHDSAQPPRDERQQR